MHEFELGVWKKIFVHLLRILQSIDGATGRLDSRWVNFIGKATLASPLYTGFAPFLPLDVIQYEDSGTTCLK